MSDVETRAERGRDCMSTIAGSSESAAVIADFMESRGALGQLAQWTGAVCSELGAAWQPMGGAM